MMYNMKPAGPIPPVPEPTPIELVQIFVDQWRKNTNITLRALKRLTGNLDHTVRCIEQLFAHDVNEFRAQHHLPSTETHA